MNVKDSLAGQLEGRSGNSGSDDFNLHDFDNHKISASSSMERAAIALAQASIDEFTSGQLNDASNLSGHNRADLDQVAATLEVLGYLGIIDTGGPAASAGTPLTLGRFKILEERGRGGFGIVLRAFDPLLQREVALKIPRPDRLINGQLPDEFIAEAQISAALVHPGIVRVYEIRRLGPVWYIASAFCNGPTLADWANDQDEVCPRQAALLVAEIAEAVHYAHARGVLHLDLKPENVLIEISDDPTLSPHPLVTDFGLAGRNDHSAAKRLARVAGTPAYMAPEQRDGDATRIGVTSDVYALGGILHDLLDRSLPLQEHREADSVVGPAKRGSKALPTRARPCLPNVPRDLSAISQKCIQADPESRYDSARDLAQDLRRYVRGESVIARRVSWVETIVRWVRRRPAISALCIMLTITSVASIVAIAEQWRRAEASLAGLRAEQANHARTAERMRKSLLNLTWLAQENKLRHDVPESSDDSELKLLREFYRDVEGWSSSTSREDASDAALRAAGHSLALLGCVKSLHEPRATDDFSAGLRAWKTVIALEPNEEAWRRALALHILTYSAGLDTSNWLWWRAASPDVADVDSESAALFEEPYADLLIQYAGNIAPFRHRAVAHQMLQAAIQLLRERHDLPDPDHNRYRLLLVAYSELTNVDEQLSKKEECHAALAAAKSMVAAAPPASEWTVPLECAIGDTFRTSFRVRERSQDLNTTLSDLAQAASYYSRGLADSQHDLSLRMTLSDIHHSAGALCEGSELNERAVLEFRASLDILDAGLSLAPGQRELIRRRAIIESDLGRVLCATGDISSGDQYLSAATNDFRDMDLSKQDSTNLWMQAVRDWQLLGKNYAAKGDRQTAIDAYQQSLDFLERVKARREHSIQYHEYLSRSRDALAALASSPIPQTSMSNDL